MRTRRLLLFSVVAAVLASGAFAVSAATGSTTPLWFIGGSELSGTESVGGLAEPGTISFAGVTTQCEHAVYAEKIFNESGQGKGKVTELPLFGCTANAGCTLTSIEAKGLPWAMHTVYEETTVPYMVIEGVKLEATYSGSSCAIKGTREITGSIGAKIQNSTQQTIFNSASAAATGTSLKAGTATVAFEGTYAEEALGPEHVGQTVEAR